MTRDEIIRAITTDFDVDPGGIRDTDTDEMLGAALEAAYRATPSDSVFDARGRQAALRQAGTNAVHMSLVMSRHTATTSAATTSAAAGVEAVAG